LKSTYWSERFLSKNRPINPVDWVSGAGRGAVWATGGGGGGAGKLSHFSEYTSPPSAIRPIGAQGLARAVTVTGGNLVCAHAGEENRRIAIASFFIDFFSKKRPARLY
jgi:hypothetical protein